jgi:hypothetical protein
MTTTHPTTDKQFIEGKAERRRAGVDLRNARKQARLTVTCRYVDLPTGDKHNPGGLCTGEAVDPDGEIRLCTRHLALTLELLRRAGLKV